MDNFERFFKRRVAQVNGFREDPIHNVFIFRKERGQETGITFSVNENGILRLRTIHLQPAEVDSLTKQKQNNSLDRKLIL